MGKLERLLSIVMILLQRDVVPAAQLAQLLHVSKRTILRDMEALGMSNIPIYSIHGVHGGYGIMEEYKLDKRLLTSKDLEHLLTALSGLGQIMVSPEVAITMTKIESMVSSTSVKSPIQLSFYEWDGRSEMAPIMLTCQQAISENRLVSFDYIDRNGHTTSRTVEPYELHFHERSWYMKGYCLDRNDYRTFKLSRTDHMNLQVRAFVPRQDAGDQASRDSILSQLVTVKALIEPRIMDHFIERYGRKSVEAYNSELLAATIQVPQNEIGFQFLASFGTSLTLLEPPSYVEDYRCFLRGLLGKYG
ncbi:YafY family protein [Paenibacillus sp. YYML68]|uniref:helix-turn-helix transcriptional regulator n=1 Tax=Paenibacillus sp. YYML68 TaxID=2909250 RepID=UPI0024919193|nr:YafY family protein [Paenibacillus sp. YYML68]